MKQAHSEYGFKPHPNLVHRTSSTSSQHDNYSQFGRQSSNLFDVMNTPGRRGVFEYKSSPYRQSDEYQRNRNSRLVNSYNVPMKGPAQYVEVVDPKTNVSFKANF